MTEMPRENVQSYPRPPALESVPHRITIMLGGVIIADTTRAFRVLETHHAPSYYIQADDITATLTPAQGSSFCEWKGSARYFDVTANGVTARRAAWSYERPTARFAPIAGYLGLYAGLMEACQVGSEKVIPQPGDFYGGWMTPNLDGIPKGSRGTEHW